MRKKLIRLFTLSLAVILMLALALSGCGADGAAPGSSAPPAGDASEPASQPAEGGADTTPITLTMWNQEPAPGIQETDVAKEIARLTGVTIDIIQGDEQKFKVLLAGGDLPDIIYVNYTSQQVDHKQLIDSGAIIPLDDLLEQYGDNFEKNFPARIDYSRTSLGYGTDNVYFLPVQCYVGDPENPNVSYFGNADGYMVRWDVYSQIGHPEITTQDDFLNVMKQMQDANPTTPDGRDVYAFSGWVDWGLYPWYVPQLVETSINMKVGWYDRETEEVSYMFNNPAFWESISFFNKAWRMGLVDPEAFTMNYQNFCDKILSGQVLVMYDSWQITDNRDFVTSGNPEWGFQKLPYDGLPYISNLVMNDFPLGFGSDYCLAITSACEDPERAMQFLNFMNSEEAARLVYSGVEGVHWEYVDGVPQPTQAFNDANAADNAYGTLQVGLNAYNKFCGMQGAQVLSDSYPADIRMTNAEKAKNVAPIDVDYCNYYGEGYEFPGMVLLDMFNQGKVKSYTEFDAVSYLARALGEDSTQKNASIEDYMNVQIPQIIMAESDDEFNRLKDEAMAEIAGRGMADIEAELQVIYAEAKEVASTFTFD